MPQPHRSLLAFLLPLTRWLAQLLFKSCRIQLVAGEQQLETLLQAEETIIPCCWHQRLFCVVGHLMGQREKGLNPGFLVSPSRDGELISQVVAPLEATIVRGSAHRTGAQALRDLYKVVQTGVSPITHPDGPVGPPCKCKPGGPLLAQITAAPLLPIGCSMNRYWQLGSWDRLMIPKPFARVTLVIGAPIRVDKKDNIEQAAEQLEKALNDTTQAADKAAGSTPATQPAIVRDASD